MLANMEQLDIDGMLALFNTNAGYQDVALDSEPTIGVEHIRFKLELSFAELSGISIQIDAFDEVATRVYVERRQLWQFCRGETAELAILCVIEFDADNKVLYWREYRDADTFHAQLPQYYLDYLASLKA
jgi:limonene-1,2-epoxide hydrolase